MATVSRKQFLQSSALTLAALAANSSFAMPRRKILLSFSTLGCPDWTFQQITDFALQHGYKGIELRGLQRQMELTKCAEFSTEESRKAVKAQMKANGLQFINLGSSATLHFAEGSEREKHLSDARRFIDLAQQINCPFIRVFPNNFPKGQEKKATLELITKGLLELGNYAKDKGVTVLLETHGDVVWADDLVAIMNGAVHPNVGLVWDAANMWTVTKEPPAEAYRKLKKYIRHVHVKDAQLTGEKLNYRLLGQGNVPIFEAIAALAKDGYKGYYSFEWEKLWHPEIAEPEVALAHYPTAIKAHLKKM